MIDAAAIAPATGGLIAGTNDLAAGLGLPAERGPPGPGLRAPAHRPRRPRRRRRRRSTASITGSRRTTGSTAECAEGRAYGFDGKSVIHPSQIETANRVFGPTEAERRSGRAADRRGDRRRRAARGPDDRGAARRPGARADRQGAPLKPPNRLPAPAPLLKQRHVQAPAPRRRAAPPRFLRRPMPRPRPTRRSRRPTMMRHIERLASDEYQGRAPGTEGERLTINYISEQIARARRSSRRARTAAGSSRSAWSSGAPDTSQVRWTARGRAVDIAAGDMLLMGREASESVADAPVVFAGHGVRMPERGIDQLAGADLNGAVVLILLQGPNVPGFPSLAARIADGERGRRGGGDRDRRRRGALGRGRRRQLRAGARPGSTPRRCRGSPGAMPAAAAQRLIAAAGGDFGRLLNDQPGSSFRAVALPIRASMEVDHRRPALHQQQCRRPAARQRRHRREPALSRPLGPFRHLPARRRGRPDLQRRGRQCQRHRDDDRGRRAARPPAAAAARHPVPRHHLGGGRPARRRIFRRPSDRAGRFDRRRDQHGHGRDPPGRRAGRGDRPRPSRARSR